MPGKKNKSGNVEDIAQQYQVSNIAQLIVDGDVVQLYLLLHRVGRIKSLSKGVAAVAELQAQVQGLRKALKLAEGDTVTAEVIEGYKRDILVEVTRLNTAVQQSSARSSRAAAINPLKSKAVDYFGQLLSYDTIVAFLSMSLEQIIEMGAQNSLCHDESIDRLVLAAITLVVHINLNSAANLLRSYFIEELKSAESFQTFVDYMTTHYLAGKILPFLEGVHGAALVLQSQSPKPSLEQRQAAYDKLLAKFKIPLVASVAAELSAPAAAVPMQVDAVMPALVEAPESSNPALAVALAELVQSDSAGVAAEELSASAVPMSIDAVVIPAQAAVSISNKPAPVADRLPAVAAITTAPGKSSAKRAASTAAGPAKKTKGHTPHVVSSQAMQLAADMAGLAAQLQRSRQAENALKVERGRLQAEVGNLKSERDGFKAQLSAAKLEIASLEAKEAAAAQAQLAMNEERTVWQQDRARLEASNTQLKINIAEVRSECLDLKSEMSKLKETNTAEKAKLQGALRSEEGQWSAEKAMLNRRLQQVDGLYQAEKARADAAEEQVATLQQKLNDSFQRKGRIAAEVIRSMSTPRLSDSSESPPGNGAPHSPALTSPPPRHSPATPGDSRHKSASDDIASLMSGRSSAQWTPGKFGVASGVTLSSRKTAEVNKGNCPVPKCGGSK